LILSVTSCEMSTEVRNLGVEKLISSTSGKSIWFVVSTWQ
jgi:hypothetical protein